MLVLIVVSASASFAIFVSQRQQERQKAEAKELRIELEKLSVKSINHIQYDSNNTLSEITFTVANLHTHTSKINMITLNGLLIKKFNVTDIEQSQDNTDFWELNTTKGHYTSNTSEENSPHLNLNPNKRIFITIKNFSNSKIGIGEIKTNDPISFEVSTILTNTFQKTFYPPTSIIKILTETQWDDYINKYKKVPILDGSLSNHPIEDEAYISTWEWNISMPYVFQDTNTPNWTYNSEDNKISTKPLGNSIANKGDKGGLYGNDTNGNPFIFKDNNITGKNWTLDKDEEILDRDPDGDGVNANPKDGNFGGLLGNDTDGNPFIFKDNNTTGTNWILDEDEEILDRDPDRDGIKANNSIGNFGGIIVPYTVQRGQKTIPNMDYLKMHHKIKLTVTDNYGMKSSASTTYYQ